MLVDTEAWRSKKIENKERRYSICDKYVKMSVIRKEKVRAKETFEEIITEFFITDGQQ